MKIMVLVMAAPFGEKLREQRELAGLSQSDLARRAGVGQSTISQYEAGDREPTWLNVVAICDALEVPLDTFRGTMPPVVKARHRKGRQEGGSGDTQVD